MSNYKLASSTWDEKELNAIQSVIDKDMYTMGDSVKQFEEDFSKEELERHFDFYFLFI